MTITLPDDVRAQAERQAAAAGFASVGEYLAALVREDAADLQYLDVPATGRSSFRTREELEALLNETLGSETKVIDAAFWDRLDERIRTRAAERGKTA